MTRCRMQLGACRNCRNHEECTFQRVFPVRECDEYQELDLAPELDMSLSEIFAEWDMSVPKEP